MLSNTAVLQGTGDQNGNFVVTPVGPVANFMSDFIKRKLSFRKSTNVLDSQASRTCRFDKRSMKMKSVEHWWDHTYRGTENYSEKTNMSQSTFSTLNPT
jgi:hypothetical protein